MEYNNIYGIQRVPETEVRNGFDIASTTTGAAAQGAKIGSQFGPLGAGIGALAGGAMGFFGAEVGQKQEELMLQGDQAHNKFVNNLEGRNLRTNNMVRAQASRGLFSNKYMMAEIEGDGSRKYQEGIGEIHVDKNFNVKTIASGAPTHEEGGMDVLMEEGDVVFPTQGDKSKFQKVLSAIKRYKLNGDSKAKTFLEKERDKLPTDEDYGYSKSGKNMYPDGVQFKTRESLESYMKKQNPTASVDTISQMSDRYIDRFPDRVGFQTKTTVEENAEYYGDIPGKDTFDFSGGNVITGKGSVAQKEEDLGKSSFKIIEDYDNAYDYKLNQTTGEVFTKKKGSDKWESLQKQQLGKTENKNKWDKEAPVVNNDIVRNRVFGEWKPPTNSVETSDQNNKITNQINLNSGVENLVVDEVGDSIEKEDTENGYSPILRDQGPVTGDSTDGISMDELTQIKNRNNPLKYSSALNNLIQGTKPYDRVTRRYYTPDEFKYEDRSQAQRRAVTEQRNFASQQLRGKGLSIGQQQGYQGQIGARYLRGQEAINEREAQRADQIDYMNTNSFNESRRFNLNLANTYDDLDARNKAARQAYNDQFYSDVSTLAQIDEQRKYIMDRDNRAFGMDKVRMGLMGDIYPNYTISPNDLGNVKFRKKAYQMLGQENK